jgi:hypothetical protein
LTPASTDLSEPAHLDDESTPRLSLAEAAVSLAAGGDRHRLVTRDLDDLGNVAVRARTKHRRRPMAHDPAKIRGRRGDVPGVRAHEVREPARHGCEDFLDVGHR